MRECMEDLPKLQARLKRIEGQIRGISDMMEKDVPCNEILIQINAAPKSALHKVGQMVVEGICTTASRTASSMEIPRNTKGFVKGH